MAKELLYQCKARLNKTKTPLAFAPDGTILVCWMVKQIGLYSALYATYTDQSSGSVL